MRVFVFLVKRLVIHVFEALPASVNDAGGPLLVVFVDALISVRLAKTIVQICIAAKFKVSLLLLVIYFILLVKIYAFVQIRRLILIG